jgi:hypothetical protein
LSDELQGDYEGNEILAIIIYFFYQIASNLTI